jgi:conjugative transposon TraM protein
MSRTIFFTTKINMMETVHPTKLARQRKFMLVLPLITLPFITLAFWALGGGRGTRSVDGVGERSGLNLQLPAPHLADDSKQNKLSFYNQAQQDSIKILQQMKNDPFYRNGLGSLTFPSSPSINSMKLPSDNNVNESPYHPIENAETKEAQIYERLDALNKAIQIPVGTATGKQDLIDSRKHTTGPSEISGDVDRLEDMMRGMKANRTDDPEMQQLGTMLDKILDVQHPERVKSRTKQNSLEKKTEVFVVSKADNKAPVTYLCSRHRTSDDTLVDVNHNSFYDLSDDMIEIEEPNAVPAVVHGTQTLAAGSTIKLRLLADVEINGSLVSKGTFVFGTASFEGERLHITIVGIKHHTKLLPVSLAVYDIDGQSGIYVPGSGWTDAGKHSASQSLQQIELMSPDPSLPAQAAAAGIEAARKIVAKKTHRIKVTVKTGYCVLLRDANNETK